MPQAAQIEGQQGQDGHLRRERLGAGDAHLGPGVEVDAAVGLAGDGAADGVDDRQGRVPAALGLAQGAEGVGGLARLAEDEDERPVVERRIAIAELAGILDLDRQVGEPLDQVLADQRRVPARPAGGEHDAADAAELAGREVQPAEDRGGLGAAEPPSAGVHDRLGLLANLLDHVVGVAAQLDRIRLPVQPIDPRRDRTVLEVAHLEVVARQADDLAVLQEGDPGGMGCDGDRVAGQQVFPLAQADDQRAAEPRADHLARPLRADYPDPIGPLQPRQGALHGLEQVVGRLQLARDQVGDDLGIGLAGEDEPLRLEFAAQRSMILDHPVMNHGDADRPAATAQMRVGIPLVGRTMRRPSRVADPASARSRLAVEQFLQEPHPAGFLPHDELIPLDRRQPGAVVAAVLEPPKPGNQDRRGL